MKIPETWGPLTGHLEMLGLGEDAVKAALADYRLKTEPETEEAEKKWAPGDASKVPRAARPPAVQTHRCSEALTLQ